MDRLSALIEQIKKHYEIAVIGSGYGGAIAASRLARAGREVVVFERGRELLPGEYPNDPVDMVGEVQVNSANAPGKLASSMTLPSSRSGLLRASMIPVTQGPTGSLPCGLRDPNPTPFITSSAL